MYKIEVKCINIVKYEWSRRKKRHEVDVKIYKLKHMQL